jgi:two-component system OmpR family sensor kinase
MSIRLRLTLLYTAILALTLIAFSSILYVSQTRATYASIKTNLAGQVIGFVRAIEHVPGPPPGQSQTAPAPAAPPEKPIVMDLSGSTLPGRWTQTRSIAGTVIGQTPDLSGTTLPLSTKGLEAVQSGSDWYETALVDTEPLLIYSVLHTTQSGVTVIVQVAFPIAQPQQALNALRLVLVVGSSLAILAAFALGWVLAGTALRPIQRITQTAQAIGAERNFGRRVEHKGPADEVGQLAVTFNAMLAELESGYRQLEDALYSQRRFVADASHELRTPLTTVRGNIELLRREPPIAAAERAEIVADTTEEVDRLIRLVNELLVLARADAGQTLRADPIPVQALIEDVCRQARLLTPNTHIQCEAPADVLAQGDRDALKQVLLILVDNALVHTPAGTQVALTAAAAATQVVFTVRDGGPGIAPEALPHIFERFYRGQASRTGRGAGLGLSIAKELVEAQGGTLTVESQLGQGSVFTIALPVALPDQPTLS